MDILFPLKPSLKPRSSSNLKPSSQPGTSRDRTLRYLSNSNNSTFLLNTAYIHKPSSHLPVSDTNEISLQLSTLRKNLDKQSSVWTKRDTFLNTLKQEMDKTCVSAKRQSMLQEVKLLEIQSLKEETEKAIRMQEIEIENRKVFLHVLDRMRTTIVCLKAKNLGYKDSLHKKSFSLIVEKEISKKVKQSRANTAIAMNRLKGVIENQKNEELREVEELEKNVEKRRMVSTNREERRKKQAEIIEKAMIESQSARLEDLREKCFMNRLWYSVTTLHFEQKQQKSNRFEEAYSRIKISTGINEVHLFVEKFLTREKSYRELLMSVKQKEVALINYQQKIEEIQRGIDGFDSVCLENSNDQEKRVKIKAMLKVIKEVKLQKIVLVQVYDKIDKWTNRIMNKLLVNSSDEVGNKKLAVSSGDIHQKIQTVKEIVVGMLRKMNKNAYKQDLERKENLKTIINEIPESSRFKKMHSLIEENELMGLEYESVDDSMRKTKRSEYK